MSVELKGGGGTDLVSVQPISKSLRVTHFNSDGTEGSQSLPLIIDTSSVTIVNDDLISSVDVSRYKFISLQLTGTWVGTVSFEGSNSNGTFYPIVSSDPSGGNSVGQSSSTTNRLVKIPTIYKFLRVRVTAYTSGSVTGVAYGHRDENSSGLISAIGPVTLSPETTKVIGTVNIAGSGGTPTYQKFISAAGTNATLVSSSASKITILHIVNGGDGLRYFKLYNKASAPTVGTDVPLITIGIPATSSSSFTLPALIGIDFSVGISFAITLGATDTNTTGLSVVGDVTGLIAYT